MASKILLRACRVTLMGRQNILMKTPQRAMAGKGKWHLRIYRFFMEIMINLNLLAINCTEISFARVLLKQHAVIFSFFLKSVTLV